MALPFKFHKQFIFSSNKKQTLHYTGEKHEENFEMAMRLKHLFITHKTYMVQSTPDRVKFLVVPSSRKFTLSKCVYFLFQNIHQSNFCFFCSMANFCWLFETLKNKSIMPLPHQRQNGQFFCLLFRNHS